MRRQVFEEAERRQRRSPRLAGLTAFREPGDIGVEESEVLVVEVRTISRERACANATQTTRQFCIC